MAGGAGFIGSHTVDELIRRGARVVVVDNLSTGRRENIHSRARFYKMDTASPRLASVFKKERPHYVFVLATMSSPPLTILDPKRDAGAIIGLINILENAVRFKVKKVLYSSSGFIYGNARTFPTPESEFFQPLAPYNISKYASEQYLKFFHTHYGLPIVILRYATVYGPRQISRVLADYIKKIRRGRRSEIYGRKTRDYIYVSDVARVNLRALEVSDYRGDPVFNISGGKETVMHDLYRMIARLLGQPRNMSIQRPAKPGEVDRFWLDIRRAKRVLGFKPRIPLKIGLEKTVEWFLKTA